MTNVDKLYNVFRWQCLWRNNRS